MVFMDEAGWYFAVFLLGAGAGVLVHQYWQTELFPPVSAILHTVEPAPDKVAYQI